MVQQGIRLVSQGDHHSKPLILFVLSADRDYCGAGKIKCGISNADAERPVP